MLEGERERASPAHSATSAPSKSVFLFRLREQEVSKEVKLKQKQGSGVVVSSCGFQGQLRGTFVSYISEMSYVNLMGFVPN